MVHEHMHRLVQRAADGTKIIPLVKRDDYSDNVHNFIHRLTHNTNAESIKLNVPAGFSLKEASSDDSSSNNNSDSSNSDNSNNNNNNGVAVEVKYVTASATFTGTTAGYVTDVVTSPAAAQTSVAAITPASVSSSAVTSSAVAVTSANAIVPTVGTPIAQSRSSAAPAASVGADSNDANANQLSQQQQSGGLTDGAKAGVAIGIIFAIALVAGLFFFCWKRAKKNTNEEYNEKQGYTEKRSSFFGAGSNGSAKRRSADSDKSFGTIHNTATAPRLSLRPVTQFLPAAFSEKRKSSMQNGPQMSERNGGWERRPQNGENPFRDPAAPAQNPFDEGDGSSQHSSKKNSWEAPATPNSAQFGTAAAVPVAAMNAQGPPRVQNNVHRVQLDFKPSMDDELELKSGQLVRLLHEYDDGWALCIRMDRSQQGVAPRTCLSKTPVKPRGPPSGRNSPQGSMRGGPPQSPVARKPVPGQAI